MGAFVDVVSAKVIGQEKGIEFAFFENFGKADPVLKSRFLQALVSWIAPLAHAG